MAELTGGQLLARCLANEGVRFVFGLPSPEIDPLLAALDAQDRALLLLRYQEGLDYQALAEATGVATGTIGSRLNRARARLRQLLPDFEPPAEEVGSAAHRIHRGRRGAADAAPPIVNARSTPATAAEQAERLPL